METSKCAICFIETGDPALQICEHCESLVFFDETPVSRLIKDMPNFIKKVLYCLFVVLICMAGIIAFLTGLAYLIHDV